MASSTRCRATAYWRRRISAIATSAMPNSASTPGVGTGTVSGGFGRDGWLPTSTAVNISFFWMNASYPLARVLADRTLVISSAISPASPEKASSEARVVCRL